MKSLTSLWSKLAIEFASRCSTSTTRDIKTVSDRVKHEGVSFLTISLPSFGKDLQYCLDQGMIVPSAFTSYKKCGSCLPSFLRGFMEQVFDINSGILLNEPSIESILAIRQLTLVFSKMNALCTPERVQAAFDDFVECDSNVRVHSANISNSDLSEFERLSELMFGPIFSRIDSKIYNREIVPKHGPGATADRLTSNGKYRSRYWTERLSSSFDYEEFMLPSSRFFDEDSASSVHYLTPEQETPVRVIAVPKTQSSPRIIAIEPSTLQYMQQGILREFNSCFSSDVIGEFICSDSQLPNQELARKGSSDGTLASIDLSEASDRVSLSLVEAMLRKHPLTRNALLNTRSFKADVPGHGVIPLAKFASMGSALCFPVEAQVFLVLCFLGIQKSTGCRFHSRDEFLPYRDSVRVYGDDIIVPVDCVLNVVDSLELFGAKVNRRKSFWIGRFRESCGKEYYSGHDVSIVKFRHNIPKQRQHVTELVSLTSFRNQLYFAGCWNVVRDLDIYLEKLLRVFPIVEPTCSALGRHSFLPYTAEKECEKLHRPLVKACVQISRSPKDPLDGLGAMLKCFLRMGAVSPDECHLERAGRPRNAYIKARWVTPY